jgi:cell division protein FtsI (penicillin-binding protein 3)
MDRTPVLTGVMPPRPLSSLERMVRFRLMIVALSISLWALGATVRLVQLQVLDRKSFERQAARQSERTINLDPRRGPILDRNGRELALSVDAESIYAVPQDIEDTARTGTLLARALGLDADARKELLSQLQRNKAFVWVKRKVDSTKARAVRDLQLDGIGFLTDTRRYYPKRELASHVLGYVGVDNVGMSGIEYSFEDVMKGRATKVVVRTDARRRPTGHTEKPATDGKTVSLTLDESIQFMAENELDRAMGETQAAAGVVVVMDPQTGEILALANRPTFNPNNIGGSPSSRWKNRAVADAYEPGSMFKIVTAAAALQEKVVDPDEILDCGGGSIDVAGTTVHDHAIFFQLPFREVLSKSSDIGFIRVGQRLGRENLNRYIREFGFGATTGVDLPGESSGLLRPPSHWTPLSLASISFGQEVGVTALQMASAVAAVANGGYLMKPLIVKEVSESSGHPVKEYKPLAVRRVLEPQTVDILTDLLKGVVREGTGTRAAVPGYVVAGKTGTAQKIDASGHYSPVDYVASFAGFVPASRPALVVLVSLDSPRGLHQGGEVAAPVFERIAEQALSYRAVPPDDPERVLRMAPSPVGGLVAAAYQPAPSVETDPKVMPDLRGKSAREAAIAAARKGLIVELKGTGRVSGQTPEPGTEIEAGMTCVLTLEASPEPTGGTQ